MDVSHIIAERKNTWRNFLAMDGPVKTVFLINYDEDIPPMPPLWRENKNKRIEWILEKYNAHVKRLEWLKDDCIPYLDMMTGTEIFAEALGCKVHYPDGSNPFAIPFVHNASEASKIKVPELSSSTLSVLFDMADTLRQRTGKDVLFRLPDIQSPMDITALIWDKNDLFPAMLDEPEAVIELADKVYQLLTSFIDEWFRRYGKEFIAHYPIYYMEQGITVSEDEVGSVSPKMCEEMFLPYLKKLSERYGGIGIHCCANSRHQWSNFRKIPGLRLLNLNQPREVLLEAYEFFADHTAQMHGWYGDGPAWTWPGQHTGSEKFAIEAWASSREEAVDLSNRLCEACGRG